MCFILIMILQYCIWY